MKRSAGFTLIELMIVVAVIGILSAIAYPSFIQQVQTSRRAEATAEIGQVQLAMERWRADRASYAGSGVAPVSTNHYTIAIGAADANGYTITGTPIGSQAGAKCGTLTLQATNGAIVKTPTTAGCWSN